MQKRMQETSVDNYRKFVSSLRSSFSTVKDHLRGVGCLVIVENEVLNGLLELIKAGKMAWLQEFALDRKSVV